MTPSDLGIFVLCVIALIPIMDAVHRWFGKPATRNITPSPLEIRAAPEFVTVKNCREFHAAQEAQFRRLVNENASEFRAVLQQELRKVETQQTARYDELRREVTQSISGVHRRVDQILEALNGGGK